MCDKQSFHLMQFKSSSELRIFSATDVNGSAPAVWSGISSLQAQDVLPQAACTLTCPYGIFSGSVISSLAAGVCARLWMHALFQLQLCQQKDECRSLLPTLLLEVTSPSELLARLYMWLPISCFSQITCFSQKTGAVFFKFLILSLLIWMDVG